MIKGMHGMFYTSAPAATRAFFRDKLGFKARDVGEGWLIFDMPAADLGFHPTDTEEGGKSGEASISFYCDDIEKTVADLKKIGVEFTEPVTDRGFGLVTHFKAPGDFNVMLYQPRY